MIYVRLFFMVLWMILCCVLGLLGCVVRWGDVNLNHYFGHLFAWGVTRIARIQVVREGLEHLEAHQPCIYVTNHQSAMDMATFGTLFPRRTVLVGKKELLYIPFFGLFFKSAGNITINRSKHVSAMASLSTAIRQIGAKNVSVWIFPEGTRNTSSELLLPFKKGAFYMALQARIPIVPIVCSPLDKVVRWKDKKMPGGTVRVWVLPPIRTTGLDQNDAEKLGKLARDAMIAALIEMRST